MKDLKLQLLEEYKYKFEFHAHTSPVSGCSEIPCDEFAQKFIGYGYDGVVITNHFTPDYPSRFKDGAEAAEFYLKDVADVKKAAGDKITIVFVNEIGSFEFRKINFAELEKMIG